VTSGSIRYVVRSTHGDREERVLELTLVDPVADEAIYAIKGVSGLRRHRLVRLAREARAQDALLTYEDLCSLLLTSRATLKRDVHYLEKIAGLTVPLAGRRKGAAGESDRGGVSVESGGGEV